MKWKKIAARSGQIPIIHKSFMPCEQSVRELYDILKACEEAQEKALVGFSAGGKMVASGRFMQKKE